MRSPESKGGEEIRTMGEHGLEAVRPKRDGEGADQARGAENQGGVGAVAILRGELGDLRRPVEQDCGGGRRVERHEAAQPVVFGRREVAQAGGLLVGGGGQAG